MVKNILIGMLSGIAFWLITTIVSDSIGELIFGGDSFILSYHSFTYVALILICMIIITCTLTIVQKLNEVKELINKLKQ